MPSSIPQMISVQAGSATTGNKEKTTPTLRRNSRAEESSGENTESTAALTFTDCTTSIDDDVSSIGLESVQRPTKARATRRPSRERRASTTTTGSVRRRRSSLLTDISESAGSDLAVAQQLLAESEARNVELAVALEESILSADSEARRAREEATALKARLVERVEKIVTLEVHLENAEERAREEEQCRRSSVVVAPSADDDGDRKDEAELRKRLEGFLAKLEAENMELREQLANRGPSKASASASASGAEKSAAGGRQQARPRLVRSARRSSVSDVDDPNLMSNLAAAAAAAAGADDDEDDIGTGGKKASRFFRSRSS